MGKYGKYADNGAIEYEADECILTGRFVDPRNSVREKVTGTPFFYRVIDSQYERVTNVMRGHWKANAPKEEAPVEAAVPDTIPVMSNDHQVSTFAFDAPPPVDDAPIIKKKGGS